MRTLQADNVGPMTWKALNVIGHSYGAPAIDYDRFAALYDGDPSIQNVVDRFDQNGLVLKGPEAQELEAEPKDTGIVSTMAKRAAKKKRKFD